MKWRLYYFLIVLIQSFFSESVAQDNTWSIKGKVLEKDRSPLQFVNVFVNNTSIGTATKADGSFLLKVPKSVEKIELVVSFIGYNTIKKLLAPSEINKNIIFLLEDSNMLKEVKITAKRDKNWKKKWRIFREGILGDSQFTADCEIMNPEVIKLEFDKDKNVVATASEPIFIHNKGLGYKIMFQMEAFISDGKLIFFAGDKFFEELKPKDGKQENRWKRLRKRAYNDSFRNFLVSLSRQRLEENGFAVFKEERVKERYLGRTTVTKEISDGLLFNCPDSSICRYDSISKRFTLHSDKPIMVFLKNHFNPSPIYADYPYKFSQIILPNGEAEFTKNGWVSKPNKMIIRDYWGSEGFSNLLPDDYEDDTNENGANSQEALAELYSENEQKFWFINGRLTDDKGLPVEGADVFVNNTENGVKTNTEGRFTLKVPSTLQQAELLINHAKFYKAKEVINPKENIRTHEIVLRPDNFTTSNEKDKEYQKNWKVFAKTLLGDPNLPLARTHFPDACEIANPEVIHFEYDETKKLRARADKPLFIQNNGLGYIITYQLRDYEYNGKESKITGDKFFEKLTAANEKQQLFWQKNQLKVYQESFKYFLISMSQNKLAENGFEVFKMRKIPEIYDNNVTVKSQVEDSSVVAVKSADLCKFDIEKNRYYLHSEYPLLVFLTNRNESSQNNFKDYPYKRSQIILKDFYLEFAKDGIITGNQQIELRDFWSQDGISGTLPDDFIMDKQNIDRLGFESVEEITPKPVNTEIVNRIATNGLQFNKEKIEIAEERNYLSVPTDFNVKISELDNNLTIFDLLRRIPGLQVRFDNNTGNYFIGFAGSSSFSGGAQSVGLSIDNNFTTDLSTINTLLSTLQVRDIATLGAVKFSNASAFGARGGNGVIIITTRK
jgi:hypothetical protein